MSDKEFIDDTDERPAPAFSDPKWKERNEDYRKRRRSMAARRRAKSSLDKELELLWDEHGAPSRHSDFENLIPTWQGAVKRFARALLRESGRLTQIQREEE